LCFQVNLDCFMADTYRDRRKLWWLFVRFSLLATSAAVFLSLSYCVRGTSAQLSGHVRSTSTQHPILVICGGVALYVYYMSFFTYRRHTGH
jgi:hypothetical protein